MTIFNFRAPNPHHKIGDDRARYPVCCSGSDQWCIYRDFAFCGLLKIQISHPTNLELGYFNINFLCYSKDSLGHYPKRQLRRRYKS